MPKAPSWPARSGYSLWAVLAGGFVGTLALTTLLRAASALRLTRMDLPFLLGTLITADRARVKAAGYAMHFVNGLLFALLYYAVLLALDRGTWWLGALLGLAHGLFAGTALVNLLLPLVHPRRGTPLTGAPAVALLEPPGFMLLNYGAATPAVTLLASPMSATGRSSANSCRSRTERRREFHSKE